jgi:hypothetical protein
MKHLLPLLLALSLSACVSGSFGDHSDIEEYPLRGATEKEGKALKRCLKTAFRLQQEHRQKTGKFFTRASEMPLDDACQDFKIAQKRTQEGYEIRAEFSEGDSTVRWSINQDEVMEEHLDPNTDLDLEF